MNKITYTYSERFHEKTDNLTLQRQHSYEILKKQVNLHAPTSGRVTIDERLPGALGIPELNRLPAIDFQSKKERK